MSLVTNVSEVFYVFAEYSSDVEGYFSTLDKAESYAKKLNANSKRQHTNRLKNGETTFGATRYYVGSADVDVM
jgi:hypothetical protein